MINKNLWIKNIFKLITEISDPFYQKKSPTEEKHRVYWYFDEAMCQLYDDNDFNKFIEQYAQEYGFKKETIEKLVLLRNSLDAYIDLRGWNRKPEETLADPEWHKIQKLAKSIVDESNRDPKWTNPS